MAALPAPGAALNAGALAKRHEAGMAQAASEAASEDDIAELEREYGEVLAGLRAQFRTGKTKSLEWRVGQLKALRRGMVAHADAVAAAVRSDLGRHNFEGVLAEVLGTTGEIDHIVSELGSWVQPEKVWHPLMVQPGSSQIQYEPKGVVLVLSPWNYRK
jgi:aldehyde dehydrogenase (NAD+)